MEFLAIPQNTKSIGAQTVADGLGDGDGSGVVGANGGASCVVCSLWSVSGVVVDAIGGGWECSVFSDLVYTRFPPERL